VKRLCCLVAVPLVILAGLLLGCGTVHATSRVRETIVTPYAGSGGTQGVGLEIKGSHGYGGEPLQIDDYNGAPEVWVSDGSLYVLYKKGWLGGEICIDDALKSNTCLTMRDIRFLHRLERRS
jgi:hypothetical protein